ALSHLLHAVSFGAGRRPGHGGVARLPAAALLSHRPPAPGAGAAFLRRDHQRPRRHVFVRSAGAAGGSLGNRRLYPCPAAQPARKPCRCAAGAARGAAMTRRQAERVAWVVGGAGLVGAAIAWILAPREFSFAWLAAL